ncbi:hypothetical protein GA0115261_109604, partial [Streptomyces sp. OspMP-M43]
MNTTPSGTSTPSTTTPPAGTTDPADAVAEKTTAQDPLVKEPADDATGAPSDGATASPDDPAGQTDAEDDDALEPDPFEEARRGVGAGAAAVVSA